jgi:hypothetical protein
MKLSEKEKINFYHQKKKLFEVKTVSDKRLPTFGIDVLSVFFLLKIFLIKILRIRSRKF